MSVCSTFSDCINSKGTLLAKADRNRMLFVLNFIVINYSASLKFEEVSTKIYLYIDTNYCISGLDC